MSSVDNRAVKMSFDNASFEKNIQMTVLSLERLKSSLDMTNAKNNFADINKASSGFNLNGVTSAIEGVSHRFLAMSTIAITALSNIANRAVDMGVNLVKSLTLAPIMGGFQEYETNMNSIQTILANTSSKGSKLTDVSAALDELNHYADQTIYNFSEMARNIGTFTAAGVDLDTSVGAIKGIANLAAISGSNSQQASTAMYQLSQAMAAGTVRLMDWNSVVNAGMGGEVFQKALFESGKALQTIAGVNGTTTFEEWTAAGNTFRGSLEQGWLTGEVLTNTLAGFTGDLTEAQILSMGYTKEQADEIMKMGEIGKDAATKVKTLTQLLSTIKEAVGSGWSQSFKIIVGDFEEAKELFTGISDVLGGMVGRSADARNQLLTGWKESGGRLELVKGIKNAFVALQLVLAPIRNAFRDIFPAQTSRTLLRLTLQFKHFTENLKIGVPTAVNLRQIFRGFFAAIEIGWHIVKGVIGVFGDLWQALKPDGSILATVAGFGQMLTTWNETLIEGGKLQDFFDKLGYYINHPREALEKIQSVLVEFKKKLIAAFNGGDIPGSGILSNILQVLQDRLDTLSQHGLNLSKAWISLSGFFGGLSDILESAWIEIRDWFKNLGQKLADNTEPGDYDAAIDTINVGLLGGIVGLLVKFFKDGVKLDFSGGLFDGLKETLDGLTGTLQDMQTKLKAEALQAIAIALGVLAGALLVLSLIDADNLAKALGAMAIGFGLLIGSFIALNTITTGAGAKLGLTALAAGLIMLAGAMLIMAFALKLISTLNWEELAKGIVGVTVLLGLMVGVVKELENSSGGFIRAGLGMLAIAIALNILVFAVKSMAEMSWEEMAQGLIGVASGLAAMVGAMKLLGGSDVENVFKNSAGLLILSIALNILAFAVKSMAELSWEELSRGLAGLAVGLGLMVGAMMLLGNDKIKNVAKNAAGLLILSIALNIMAQAIKSLADLSWEELARGLAGAAGALILMAGAAYIMKDAVYGAFAIVVMAGALKILSGVLIDLSSLSWMDLVKGLTAIAGVFVVIGLASLALAPALIPLLGLATAMFLIGLGMAAFGLGVNALSRGVVALLKVGDGLVGLIMTILDAVLSELPKILTALAEGLLGFVQTFLDGLPTIISSFVIVLEALLQAIIDLIPKIVETTITVIDALLKVIVDKAPEVVAAGFSVLIAFLTGIRDNIGEIVKLVSEIIVNFLDALGEKIPEIIDAVFNFVVDVIEGVVGKLVDIGEWLVPRGLEFLGGLITGIGEKSLELALWFTELPGKILGWIGDALGWLKDKGIDILKGMYNGIVEGALELTIWFLGLPGKIWKLLNGAKDWLVHTGKDIIQGLWNGLVEIWKKITAWVLEKVQWIKNQWQKAIDMALDIAGVGSVKAPPVDENGKYIPQENTVTQRATTNTVTPRRTNAFQETLDEAAKTLQNMDEFSPVITPVLDLTDAQKKAKELTSFFRTPVIDTTLSFDQARGISLDAEALRIVQETLPATQEPTELRFEQTIIAPTALNTTEIFRQTRSQIRQAKEEFSIP